MGVYVPCGCLYLQCVDAEMYRAVSPKVALSSPVPLRTLLSRIGYSEVCGSVGPNSLHYRVIGEYLEARTHLRCTLEEGHYFALVEHHGIVGRYALPTWATRFEDYLEDDHMPGLIIGSQALRSLNRALAPEKEETERMAS